MSDIKIMCSYDKLVDPYELIENPKNPNRHPEKQIEILAKLIKSQGFRRPIVVSNRSGFVTVGHGRLLAAKYLEMETVPVDYQDYESEAKEWADMVADNKIAELSEFDKEAFKDILAEIDADFDYSLFGCRDNEIDGLLAEIGQDGIVEDNIDIESAISEARNNTRVSYGEIWELGSHRLFCGDSTNLRDVTLLMDGKLADMVFTDPPYNVNYTGATKEKLKIKNDKMDNQSFGIFLDKVMHCCFESMKPGAGIYVCHADSASNEFRRAFTGSGLSLKQCLIWLKNVFTLGRNDYQWRHEPILYGHKPGAAHKFYGGRKQGTVIDDLPITVEKSESGFVIHILNGITDIAIKVPSYELVDLNNISTIWRVDKPLRNDVHPTMKPIALCAKAIVNSSKAGGIVLDLFGGSGSTLIAAEQSGRRCYMMEIDPVYCTVILNRFEAATGLKAKKI